MPEFSSYDKAKAGFEAVVTRMQADLQNYVASGKANQRAVDVRTTIINNLIEFYEAAEVALSEADLHKTELIVKFSKLHADTQKLIYWCHLHGIHPDQIFLYSDEEIIQLIRMRRRFRSPSDLEDSENETINQQNQKYITTGLLCLRRQIR